MGTAQGIRDDENTGGVPLHRTIEFCAEERQARNSRRQQAMSDLKFRLPTAWSRGNTASPFAYGRKHSTIRGIQVAAHIHALMGPVKKSLNRGISRYK